MGERPPNSDVACHLALDSLSDHVQANIASKVTTSDLARLRAVSKAWKAVADITEVRIAAFKGTWGLAEVSQEPRKPNFYLAAGLGHFVSKVKLGTKVSLASILVRFKTDTVTLRVVNNCTSDFTLQSRPHIYVPVSHRGQLFGSKVTFTFDPVCSRQLIVLQSLNSGGPSTFTSLSTESRVAGTLDTLARTSGVPREVRETHCDLDELDLSDNQREALLKKLSRQMGRGLNIDEGTAAYYLDLARGDMKQAFIMFKEDLAWEAENPKGILPLRERLPI